MFKMSKVKLFLAVSAVALAMAAGPLSTQAQDISQDQIKALQDQINTLQKQLEEVKAAQTQAAAKAAATTPAPAAESKEAAIKPEGRGTLAIGERPNSRSEALSKLPASTGRKMKQPMWDRISTRAYLSLIRRALRRR